MKAMILAAGLGTRLKPLTDSIPKALITIGDVPLLEIIIQKLISADFDEIIINIHHFGQQIIDFVESKNQFGIHIEYSKEDGKLLDTGGALKKASWFFNDNKPFLLHNVDILSNVDLRNLYSTHLNNKCIATLMVSERNTARHFLFDKENQLKGWVNNKTGEIKPADINLFPRHYQQLAFSGVQVIDPSIFKYMETYPEKFSIIDFYLSICSKEKLIGYVPENLKLMDAGKIDTLIEAEEFVTKYLA